MPWFRSKGEKLILATNLVGLFFIIVNWLKLNMVLYCQ